MLRMVAVMQSMVPQSLLPNVMCAECRAQRKTVRFLIGRIAVLDPASQWLYQKQNRKTAE